MMKMTGEISKLARYVLLLYFIATVIFGVWFFLSPESWNSLTGWPEEIAAGRMVGAAFTALAIGSFLAYRAKSWEQIQIFVMLIIIWALLAVVGMLWNIATQTLPVAAWLMSGLAAVFLILFLYIYYQAKK